MRATLPSTKYSFGVSGCFTRLPLLCGKAAATTHSSRNERVLVISLIGAHKMGGAVLRMRM